MAQAKGCRNIIILLIVLALAGLVWAMAMRAPSNSFLGMVQWVVGVISIGIVGFTVMGLFSEFRWIADWIAMPRPESVQHPVLGELRYEARAWSSRIGKVKLHIGGRRSGPEAEAVELAARIVSRLPEAELRARTFALGQFPELADEPLGELLSIGVHPSEPEQKMEVSMWFRLWRCEHDGLEVAFASEEPVRLRRPICVGIQPGETLPPIPD